MTAANVIQRRDDAVDHAKAADQVRIARAMLGSGVRLVVAPDVREAKLAEIDAMPVAALRRFAEGAARSKSVPRIPTAAARQALAALDRADEIADVDSLIGDAA